MAEIKIVMTRHGQGEVWIDGIKAERVVAFRFIAGVGETNKLELVQNIMGTVSIEGPAEPSRYARAWIWLYRLQLAWRQLLAPLKWNWRWNGKY